MKKLLPILLILCLVSCITQAQSVNYNDVGVIVNMNSDTSILIANYFKAKRNIPDVNIIPVYTDTAEEITESVFSDYFWQIENYMNENNLPDFLNYLVTTKGCPLKVNRNNSFCDASCEGDLMLMPGYLSDTSNCLSMTDIDDGTFLMNPYFQQTTTFSQAQYSIYLITRLDAYTMQNVLDMIDSSGPNTYVNKDSALFVLNPSANWNGNPLNDALYTVADTLTNRGWRVNLINDTVYATYQRNVLGYWSWGSNDAYANNYTVNAIPYNTWSRASIAETGVSTGGRSFEPGTTYGQSLIADLLAEGCTASKGYVYEPYTISIAHPDILFPLYTDLNADGTPQYNLAESYFSASEMIAWMDVVIGDPKTSITTIKPAVTSVNEAPADDWIVYPNPARDFITIGIKANPSTATISLMDMNGRGIMSTIMNGDLLRLNTQSIPAGVYNLQIQTEREYFSKKVVILR